MEFLKFLFVGLGRPYTSLPRTPHNRKKGPGRRHLQGKRKKG